MIDKLKFQEGFGTKVPQQFLSFFDTVNEYCEQNKLEKQDAFFDLFNFAWIGGFDLRYFSTPIEFFPFATNGSGGEHFGYVIHVEGQKDYKAGYYDPINSDGIEFLGNNTQEMIQHLLTDEEEYLKKMKALLDKLDLDPVVNSNRFDVRGSLEPQVPVGWKWKPTADGVGVLAREDLFNPVEISKEEYSIVFYNRIRVFMEMALNNKSKGFYGTALYFLKELYYYEFTDFSYAIKILTEMEDLYEILGRSHLKRAVQQLKIRISAEI